MESADDRSDVVHANAAATPEVGLVRSIGGGGIQTVQAWVRCARRDACVAVEQCKRCAECAAITHGPDGKVRAVRCLPNNLGGDTAPRRLTTKVKSVGEVMTRNVLCVQPDLSLDSVLALFVERGFKAVPVVDERGRLLGVVSESDVLMDMYSGRDEREPEASRARLDRGMHEEAQVRTVADVMAPLVFSVHESASVTRAAALMAYEGVHRLAVRASDGRVIGLLSASDVLFWIARADGYAVPPPTLTAE